MMSTATTTRTGAWRCDLSDIVFRSALPARPSATRSRRRRSVEPFAHVNRVRMHVGLLWANETRASVQGDATSARSCEGERARPMGSSARRPPCVCVWACRCTVPHACTTHHPSTREREKIRHVLTSSALFCRCRRRLATTSARPPRCCECAEVTMSASTALASATSS